VVHAVAAQAFDAEAEAYERGRPTYPEDAVDWMVATSGVAADGTAVDLAAGTGIFTRLLARRVSNVAAVEPVAGMARVLRRQVPGVPVISGTAESLPFRDASLDLVTVAQAFHWFDTGRAFRELARVLRPGGAVALVWNARIRTEPWVDAVWSVMDRVEKHAPWRDHGDGTSGPRSSQTWANEHLAPHEGFSGFEAAVFGHEQVVTPDDVVDRMRSVSHVAALAPEAQGAVLDEIREIVTTHPDAAGRATLAIPYRVDAYCARRL
jgi:SAM-dependent methyltransferase